MSASQRLIRNNSELPEMHYKYYWLWWFTPGRGVFRRKLLGRIFSGLSEAKLDVVEFGSGFGLITNYVAKFACVQSICAVEYSKLRAGIVTKRLCRTTASWKLRIVNEDVGSMSLQHLLNDGSELKVFILFGFLHELEGSVCESVVSFCTSQPNSITIISDNQMVHKMDDIRGWVDGGSEVIFDRDLLNDGRSFEAVGGLCSVVSPRVDECVAIICNPPSLARFFVNFDVAPSRFKKITRGCINLLRGR
ncbi:hypothetical protein OAP65_04610 [Litorivicinus sp.]|nr:hypothetical protein [Litorivicinus sp.]